MLCGKCGKKVSGKEKFCPLCGAPVEKRGPLAFLHSAFPSKKREKRPPDAVLTPHPAKRRRGRPAYLLLGAVAAGILCVGLLINGLINSAYKEKIKVSGDIPQLYLTSGKQLKYADIDGNIITVDEKVSGARIYTTLDQTACYVVTGSNLHLIQNGKSYTKLSQDTVSSLAVPKSGDYIAYTLAGESSALYHMNVKTRESQLVTKNAGEFALSPDGKTLCYYDAADNRLYKRAFGKKASVLLENTAGEPFSVVSISKDGNTAAYFSGGVLYVQEKEESYYISDKVQTVVTDYDNANFYIFCDSDLFVKKSKSAEIRIEGGESSLSLSTLKTYPAQQCTSSDSAQLYTLLSIMPRDFSYIYEGKAYFCDNKTSTLVSSFDGTDVLLSSNKSTLFYVDSGDNLFSAALSKGKVKSSKRLASGVSELLQARQKRVLYRGNDDQLYWGKAGSAKPVKLENTVSVSLLPDSKTVLYLDNERNFYLLSGKKPALIGSGVTDMRLNLQKEKSSEFYYLSSGTLVRSQNGTSSELDTEVASFIP